MPRHPFDSRLQSSISELDLDTRTPERLPADSFPRFLPETWLAQAKLSMRM